MSDTYLNVLDVDRKDQRLQSLKSLQRLVEVGEIKFKESRGFVNNHIHTTYSFSPYSPSRAVWEAKAAGLLTAGIVDHDSAAGIDEFIKAGRILNMETTVGLECRVDMSQTPFATRRLNNTDQTGIAYVTMQGIPHHQVDRLEAFLAPYREKRNVRNKKMVENINKLFGEAILDFDKDVLPLSMYHDGGSVTERHLMFALAKKMIKKYGKGSGLIKTLNEKWNITIKGNVLEWLMDVDNPYYDYDLLSLLKGNFVGKIYVDATDECPDVKEFVALADEVGAVSAYAYLGDVKNSVTGDKADAKFEDDYVEELFEYLKELDFDAITYMPSRNTKAQLKVVRELCDKHDFFQISGEDINSPRQSFECEALLDPDYKNLIDATWTLIEREKKASK